MTCRGITMMSSDDAEPLLDSTLYSSVLSHPSPSLSNLSIMEAQAHGVSGIVSGNSSCQYIVFIFNVTPAGKYILCGKRIKSVKTCNISACTFLAVVIKGMLCPCVCFQMLNFLIPPSPPNQLGGYTFLNI